MSSQFSETVERPIDSLLKSHFNFVVNRVVHKDFEE